MELNKQKPKILFLISDLHIGGACSLLINNAIELQNQGYTVRIVYFGPNESFLPKLNRLELIVRRIPFNGGFLNFLGAVKELIAFIRTNEIALIHSNLHLDIRFGVLSSFFTRRPLVVTLHALRYAAMNFGTVKYKILRVAEDVLLLRARKLIAVSKAVKEDQWRILKSRTEVVYSGVSIIPFTDEADRANFSILHVGRIDPVKNQLFSVRVLSQLRQAGLPAVLAFVGEGGDLYKAEIRRLALEEGVAEYIRFEGAVQDVSPFYAKYSILLVPSHSESFGLVAVEGMMAGIIVVAADVPGLNEVMSRGQTGFYFPPGDVHGAVRIISDLQKDARLYQQIARNACKCALEKFSVSASVRNLSEVYKSIV